MLKVRNSFVYANIIPSFVNEARGVKLACTVTRVSSDTPHTTKTIKYITLCDSHIEIRHAII